MTTQDTLKKERSIALFENATAPLVVLDTITGAKGTYAEWVEAFAQRWAHAKENLERFMDILSPDVVLRAPGLRTTRGREAGYRAFAGTFSVLPDLTGKILCWSASGDVLFIEMLFSATIGGKLVRWYDVDRFLFRDGVAVERTAYFDPTPIRRAYLRSPACWRQLWLIRRIR